MKSIDKLGLVASSILLFVFAVVVFHAPLSVYFGQFLPVDIVKSWKEILLIFTIPLVFIATLRTHTLSKLTRDRLLQLITIYATLHIIFLFCFDTSSYQKASGLAIDLRYLLFFVLVYCVVYMWPQLRQRFLLVGAFSAGLSMLFALLQATILPNDILKYIGYSKHTIEPYLTVDKNPDFVRINGTLRGPNPLGAYVVVLLNIVLAWAVTYKKKASQYKWMLLGLSVLLATVLWASYSRSAWLAMVVSILALVLVRFQHVFRLKNIAIIVGVMILFGTSMFMLRNSSLVQNVLLHNNPTGGSSVDSNEAHADSLEHGSKLLLLQPYGAGIGSTGSASLNSDKPLIIENQYLFIAHESGWFGLGLFVAIYMLIIGRAYTRKNDWLNLAVFSSGVGLAVIGLLLPVWVDDTVSLIWFGLAAIALASKIKKEDVKHGKTSN